MNGLTTAIYEALADDATLTAMLATYMGEPAIFTTDPAPGDATLPYIVTAGNVADAAHDTKTRQGRQVWRDVRCYAAANGSAAVVEAMAERVRALLHRHPVDVTGYDNEVIECAGPITQDDPDAYGRIVTIKLIAMEG